MKSLLVAAACSMGHALAAVVAAEGKPIHRPLIIVFPPPATTSSTSFVAATAGRSGSSISRSTSRKSISSRKRKSIVPSSSSLPSSRDSDSNSISSPPGAEVPLRRRRRSFDFPPIDDDDFRLVLDVFGGEGRTGLVPLSLAGMMRCRSSGATMTTIFLSPPELCRDVADAHARYLGGSAANDKDGPPRFTGLPVPLPSSDDAAAVSLLCRAYSSDVPVSKSALLSYNSLLVNRDGGLFDNLPWSTWSIDPTLGERDAAGNVFDSRFATGKRAAYQRFMGKDWRGRSLSLGNLANRVRFLLDGDDDGGGGDGGSLSPTSDSYYVSDGTEGGRTRLKARARDGDDENDDDDSAMMLSLAYRLLRLEVREAAMEVAESEQRLAIIISSASRSSGGGESGNDVANDSINEDVAVAREWLEITRDRLRKLEASLRKLEKGKGGTRSSPPPLPALSFLPFAFPWDKPKKEESKRKRREETRSLLSSIFDRLAEQQNPPYRGAIGYPAKLDSREDIFERSALPYSSPYELLLDIIEEQLNSKVVGCVLEPASLLEGNLVLGGALLLKRQGVPKTTTLLGEAISYTDDDDALGNEGVLPRSMYVVECFSDEAVGMAMASGMPIFVEEGIYNQAGGISVELDLDAASSVRGENMTLSVTDRVPPVRPTDGSYIPQMEGERVMSERESNLLRIPMTTNPGLFDGPKQSSTPSLAGRSASVFSTFVPVRSLGEYDALTDDAKAKLLLKLESFSGILPRPRAVRSSSKVASQYYSDGIPTPSILDEILLPLIDESVRRQYKIRDATRRGDFDEANALRTLASPQHVALERAQRARQDGLEVEALRMEEEAELYRSLRADPTQDELAYSRDLDRDEWYERETRDRIKRLNKSKVGTLLDGVDLP